MGGGKKEGLRPEAGERQELLGAALSLTGFLSNVTSARDEGSTPFPVESFTDAWRADQ